MTATHSAPAAAAGPTGPVFAAEPDAGILAFDGPDAAAFLHGQLSSDVAGMAVGAAGWTSYNSPKGRMLASLLLWRAAPDAYRAFAAADLAPALAKRLAMFVLRAKVKLADVSAAGRRFGVAGPGAAGALAAVLGTAPAPGHGVDADGVLAVATPDGRFLVHAPAADAERVRAALAAQAREIGTEDWRWLGVRTGVPTIALATQDLFVPQAANWDLVGGVNFRKGCYPGQEIVARMQYLGRLKERLFAFHVAGPPPAPATRLFGAPFGDQPCGTVVNAAPAPAGGSDLLAVVQWAAAEAGALHLDSPDGPPLAPRALPYAVPVPTAPERPKL